MTPTPETSKPDWKQTHANDAEQATRHPIVKRVVGELLSNLNANGDALVRYGVMKVATYAAQVARAQALGFDPNLLLLSDAEATEAQLRLAQMAVDAGKPVVVVIAPKEAL